jgi:choline dehydrogenase-like flavoprotein
MESVTAPVEVIIVGSGPSAVSAAFPLVDAGKRVLMLEAGADPTLPVKERPPLADARGQPRYWKYLLGERLQALRDVGKVSPKIRTATMADAGAVTRERDDTLTENFTAMSAALTGGLSNLWGAGAVMFDDTDMRGWPIARADLDASYRSVCSRIGVSGSESDDLAGHDGAEIALDPPMPLSGPAAAVFAAYERQKDRLGVRIGRMRQAVLTRDRATRSACTLDNFCMWGCARGAIYNALHDVQAMQPMPGFAILNGCRVTAIRRSESGWSVECENASNGAVRAHHARFVVLAAGTLATTRLVLDLLGRNDQEIRLHSTPAFGAAFVMPARLGSALERRSFGLGQLTVRAPLPDGNYAFGTLFHADSVAAGDLAASMPFSRAGALAITRALLPALIASLIFLPSEFSANKAALRTGSDGRRRLVVSGAVRADAAATARAMLGRAARDLWRLGLVRLPGSTVTYPPGSESHLGGTLPMGGTTSRDGEVQGAPGLFAADGSVLPSLPAKHHTLTVMANADRIGRSVLSRLAIG